MRKTGGYTIFGPIQIVIPILLLIGITILIQFVITFFAH